MIWNNWPISAVDFCIYFKNLFVLHYQIKTYQLHQSDLAVLKHPATSRKDYRSSLTCFINLHVPNCYILYDAIVVRQTCATWLASCELCQYLSLIFLNFEGMPVRANVCIQNLANLSPQACTIINTSNWIYLYSQSSRTCYLDSTSILFEDQILKPLSTKFFHIKLI